MNKIYLIILIIIISVIGLLLYNKLAFLNIVVRFDDLEPIEKQMNVYYKGFKIGRTTKIYPDKDYKNTHLNLRITPHNINLPDNITAKIKKNTLNSYVNIVYPDSPSIKRIKNYDIIRGVTTKDLNSVLNDKLSDGGIDKIVDDTTTLMESANTTVKNLGDIFYEINTILKDMRKDILNAAANLSKTTENLENLSENLNNSLDEETMKNSAESIEAAVKNINEITGNINGITTQIDKTTIPIVNSVLCETNSTVKNVKEITCGIRKTLKKHMGLGRIMFGKPIKEECGCKN